MTAGREPTEYAVAPPVVDDDAEVAALVALAGLPDVGPAFLRSIARHHRPTEALSCLATRRPLHPMVGRRMRTVALERLQAAAAASEPAASLERCRARGIVPIPLGDDRYPAQLLDDPEAPVVLFAIGDLDALLARRAGIVGTRNATTSGLATAAELGEALAAAGVSVVSGLALGTDAAAHRGVRAAGGAGRPVAVVGNGLDVSYPRRNAELWRWVGEAGLLLSEWPPGIEPAPWRFPLRNRVLAALCEVLVVVESRERGGSLITARAAAARSIDVMAVPGSPRSRASAGTNRLLVDGAAPVTTVDDVLVALGLDHRRAGAGRVDPRPRPDRFQSAVLALCRAQPCTVDDVVSTLGVEVASAALALARLERDGWLAEAGGWFEAAGSRLQA